MPDQPQEQARAAISDRPSITRIIADDGGALSNELNALRRTLFPPASHKLLRSFSSGEAAKLIGVADGYLRQLSLASKGPQPEIGPGGRRSYTLDQINELRQLLDDGPKAKGYVPHRTGDARRSSHPGQPVGAGRQGRDERPEAGRGTRFGRSRAMSANIATTFAELKREGRGGLIAYLTAGDPDADRSVALLESVAAAGADVLEVGVPFSDPLADGPVIQRAVERALASGTNLRTTLDIVQRVRRRVKTPIVLFTYGNPVLRMGVSDFSKAAVTSGADAVLILDYPVEE